eukprot:1160451-Pelagomonas_calceolata.AAC.5
MAWAVQGCWSAGARRQRNLRRWCPAGMVPCHSAGWACKRLERLRLAVLVAVMVLCMGFGEEMAVALLYRLLLLLLLLLLQHTLLLVPVPFLVLELEPVYLPALELEAGNAELAEGLGRDQVKGGSKQLLQAPPEQIQQRGMVGKGRVLPSRPSRAQI